MIHDGGINRSNELAEDGSMWSLDIECYIYTVGEEETQYRVSNG